MSCPIQRTLSSSVRAGSAVTADPPGLKFVQDDPADPVANP
ncbi:hypothetical protein DFR71_4567 [Nocardia alba]|uniref:Uncharacterized protein n=1 Tax=Nocardia alba TaxID=225051 RepID=A0A4R1FPZ7_9NOCA|nr:hypothetical protein DFR71_4567 [Nocardia alba]